MTFVEHRRSARFHAVLAIGGFLVMSIVSMLLYAAIQRMMPRAGLFQNLIIAAGELFALWFFARSVFRNWMSGGEFYFRLDDRLIECSSPVEEFAPSFQLPTREVTVVGERKPEYGARRYWMETAEGRRYWLTSHYGNPAAEIITVLRTLRPELGYVKETGPLPQE